VSGYDLKSVDLPRLQGAALRVFAGAVGAPGLGAAISGKLVSEAGVPVLSAAPLTHPPQNSPLEPACLPDPNRVDPEPDLSPLEGTFAKGPLLSTHALQQAYLDGRTDPVKVAHLILERVQSLKGQSSLFIEQDDKLLLAEAEASRQRWADGQPQGPLDGIPVAIKDEVDMVPYPTTVGTTFLGRGPASHDATAVARLRNAKAMLLGKANMHEIGINPNGANPHYGLVRNPYDPSRDPGGSSSGSAATVAAGLCPLSLGADGGGSIRIPAALCGVAGLKATYGRVSEHGAAPLCWSVGHLGPIGATVSDVALGYALMGGPDARDPNTLVQPRLTLGDFNNGDLRGLRLGIYTPWFEHAEPDIVNACRAAMQPLVTAGASIVEVEIPNLDLIRVSHAITILTEMATAMERYPEDIESLAPHVRVNLTVGRQFTACDYIRAQRVRAMALETMRGVFSQADLLISPTTATTAPKIPVQDPKTPYWDLATVTELMRYAFLGNFTGHPGLTVPVGYDSAQLPIGLQLMGPHWQEALLLRVGRVVEAAITRQLPPEYLDLGAA